MKKIGSYTVRGKISNDAVGTHRIQLFDGKFNTGYVVTKIDICPGTWASDTADCFLICNTQEDTLMNAFNPDWDSNTQIAWAAMSTLTSEELSSAMYNVVDPDNLIIEDLHIAVRGDQGTNYMIHMDKYEFNDWRGALGMVRNKSQGEGPATS